MARMVLWGGVVTEVSGGLEDGMGIEADGLRLVEGGRIRESECGGL